MKRNSASREMSIRTSGCASLYFIVETSVWPPAMTLASGIDVSAACASESDLGR
jgi:hypothetical protein